MSTELIQLKRTGAIRAFLTSPTGLLSLACLAVLAVLAVMGPDGFGPSATTIDVVDGSQTRSPEHILGTDSLGRDIFLRTLAATRLSLGLSVLAVLIAVVVGTLLGGLIAAGGPRVRRVGGVVLDTTMSLGALLLAIVIVTIVGVGSKGVVIAIGLAFAPNFARYIYGLVNSVMAKEHLAAAQTVGLGRSRIFGRYVMANVGDSLAIAALAMLGDCLIAMSSMSFLGLGVQSPAFDWGQMLTDGVDNFYLNPYACMGPAVMIIYAGFSLALFGDALARALNPVLWSQGGRSRRPRTNILPHLPGRIEQP